MSHPPRYDDKDPLLGKVRAICLAMPEAQEKISHGRPNFYTKKVFAMFGAVPKGDHGSDIYSRSVVFLPDSDERAALLEDSRFFVPGYVGAYGWIGIDLRGRKPDWDEIAELVDESYRNTAPKSLIKLLDSRYQLVI